MVGSNSRLLENRQETQRRKSSEILHSQTLTFKIINEKAIIQQKLPIFSFKVTDDSVILTPGARKTPFLVVLAVTHTASSASFLLSAVRSIVLRRSEGTW